MIRRGCLIGLLTGLAALGGVPAAAQQADDDGPPVATSHAVVSRSGVIQELDLANNRMIVDGLEYGVAPDAKVEIGGSYGAFTMLRKGMKIYYEFLLISSNSRRIIKIQELPSDVAVDAV